MSISPETRSSKSVSRAPRIPLARPAVADPARVAADIERILRSGVLTNGPYVQELETRAAFYLGVEHCVAVSSCTAGLMLVLRALDLAGDVVVPSFTFAATVHAVDWNHLRPAFADIDARTLTIDPSDVERAIGVHTSAILATHTFGTPCDVGALERIAESSGLRLVFDAAHAFGSSHHGRRIGGFGSAEVFSLSPTKTLIAAEGGLVATDDGDLAERLRIGRDYGNPGDYDCRFVGLNARMSELHAATALASLRDIDQRLIERNRLATMYRDALTGIEGISLPMVSEEDRSTYKDFTILIHPDVFGRDAGAVGRSLAGKGIETRRYYAPPVHRMHAYRHLNGAVPLLPVTTWAAARVLTLPLWVGMSDPQIVEVVTALRESGPA
jgi:dTDP-4-amino-4,6-dideoxygalactose transaminase